MTVDAGETQRAGARVRVNVLITGGAVLTRIGVALVDIDLALLPFETIDTEAHELAYAIQASASILTRG